MFRFQNEMIVFVRAITWIGKEQATGHPQVNLQIGDRAVSWGIREGIRKTKEEAFSVSAAVDYHLAHKMGPNLICGGIPVNPGCWM